MPCSMQHGRPDVVLHRHATLPALTPRCAATCCHAGTGWWVCVQQHSRSLWPPLTWTTSATTSCLHTTTSAVSCHRCGLTDNQDTTEEGSIRFSLVSMQYCIRWARPLPGLGCTESIHAHGAQLLFARHSLGFMGSRDRARPLDEWFELRCSSMLHRAICLCRRPASCLLQHPLNTSNRCVEWSMPHLTVYLSFVLLQTLFGITPCQL